MMKSEPQERKFKQIKPIHVVKLCAVMFVFFLILGTAMLAAGGPWKINIDLRDGLFTVLQSDHPVIVQGYSVIVDEQVEQELTGLTEVSIATVMDDVILVYGSDKLRAHLQGKCLNMGVPVRLESSLQGNKLVIETKHPKNSWGNKVFRINWKGLNCSTALTITIPDDYHGDLAIGTVSGGIHARNLSLALNEVTLKTVSGDVDFSTAGYQELSAKTVSGDLALWNVTAPTDVNTVSGDVDIHFEKVAQTHIKTVSGDVDLVAPEGESFEVKFQSTSGEFESSFPGLLVKSVRRSFQGSAGNGGVLVEISTTSGDCELKVAN